MSPTPLLQTEDPATRTLEDILQQSPFHLDERTSTIIQRICTVMYLVTILMLSGAMIYREFVIGQPIRQFEDMAVILTVNVLVAIGSGLYLTGVSVPKLKPLVLILGYVAFVSLGFAFTMFKDAVLLHREVDLAFALTKLRIIATICGVMVAAYTLIAWLGYRRMEREIE